MAICYGMMLHPVIQVYRVYLYLDDTNHAHSARTPGSDNLRHYNRCLLYTSDAADE